MSQTGTDLKSLSNAPEIKVYDENKVSLEGKVSIKFIKSVGRYNSGEVATINKTLAQIHIGKDQAVLVTSVQTVDANLGMVITQAIDCLHNASDAIVEIEKQEELVQAIVDKSSEAVDRAHSVAADEIEKANNSLHLFQEKCKKDQGDRSKEIKQADKGVSDAQKVITKAEKDFKKAEDKIEAQELIDSATDKYQTAVLHSEALEKDFENDEGKFNQGLDFASAACDQVITSVEQLLAGLEKAVEDAHTNDS